MKRNLHLLLGFIFLIIGSYGFAQIITNGSFENWNTTNAYDDPTYYNTSNIHSFFAMQNGNVNKSTDHIEGNFSAKLETFIYQGDTLIGIITNSDLEDDIINGGTPYAMRPDSFYFQAKYQVGAGDSAVVAMLFKSQGNIIGMGIKKLTGNQTSWNMNATEIQWLVPVLNPDTMIFIAISSDPDGLANNNSILYIDDVHFGSSYGTVPNGSFETWIGRSYEEPNAWSTFNFISIIEPPAYITKSTDAYSGSFALSIKTTLINNGQDTIAHISNGDLLREDWMSGMAVNNNPAKLSGYYKYQPIGNDTALVAIRTSRWDAINNQNIVVEENLIKLGAENTYTYFEIDLKYNAWPRVDTFGIAFASSNIYDGKSNVNAGSQLWIDSLNIIYFPVGIIENDKDAFALSIFPQPATNYVNFKFEGNADGFDLFIYDAQGRLIKSVENQHQNSIKVETSNLSKGVYYYKALRDGNSFQGNFQIQ